MPARTITNKQLCIAGDSCLLVIDVQTRLTAAMPAKVLERLKRNSMMLVNTADLLSIPVFATQQYPQGLGPIIPEISEKLPGTYVHFDKTCFSCVDAEGFTNKLGKAGRKQIIILGLEAHICVLQTAIDLLAAGYQVFVVVDAVCSRQRENYENAIQRLQQSGAMMCSTESVMFEWLKDARHEHFKAVSGMTR